MRRRRRILIGALALISGGIAGYTALLILDTRPTQFASAAVAPGTVPVVVAARDLNMGSIVTQDDVKTVEWPEQALPEGHAGQVAQVVGRGLITPAFANEPLLADKLADRDSGGLPILIPEGMRAMSVKVDEVVGVAGFVLPGTVVDVVSTVTPPGGTPTSRVILQNVRTLAAGQTIARDAEGEPMAVTVITLLVTPGDAEQLALAATQGRIQLALRNTLDQSAVDTEGSDIASLLRPRSGPDGAATASAPTPVRERPNPTVIEVFRGGVRTLITY